MAYLHCKKCLCSRTGDKLGDPCKSPRCDGVIEEAPEFNTLVDELPEEFYCPRREESPLGARVFPGPDHWQKFKAPHGNRVCSYCGSLHWEDMLALVHEAAIAPEDAPYHSVVSIEPSDKSYKCYVHQPGVRNAHEGGIKWYMQHLPRSHDGKISVTEEQQAEYALAVKRSRARFDKWLSEQYPERHEAKKAN
jgi:hypothetical protein